MMHIRSNRIFSPSVIENVLEEQPGGFLSLSLSLYLSSGKNIIRIDILYFSVINVELLQIYCNRFYFQKKKKPPLVAVLFTTSEKTNNIVEIIF